MAARTDVRHFFSTDTGAPQIAAGNTNGALIAVIDGFLLNGYNTKTVTGVTLDGANLATFTTSSAHGLYPRDVVEIAGATPSDYNGDWRIAATPTTTTFTVQMDSNPGALSGTVTVKKAPIRNWIKAFSGTNKAAYKSTDPAATGFYLAVHDTTSAHYALVRGFEQMTDVDRGNYAFPNLTTYPMTTAYPGYSTWLKSQFTAYNSTWAAIGDSRGFYFWISNSNASQTYISTIYNELYYFGDYESLLNPDPTACILVPHWDTNNASPTIGLSFARGTTSGSYLGILARNPTKMVNGQTCEFHDGIFTSGTRFGVSGLAIPNTTDYRLYHERMKIVHSTLTQFRGYMPGVLVPLHANPYTNTQNSTPLSVVGNIDGYPGREFLVMPHSVAQTPPSGQLLFDLTGPWRT